MRRVRHDDTVRAKSGYHHGDLANALTAAATDLARRGGPDAVVLREAARQVGVSPTAAYRHFAGHGDLIEAVKQRALVGLADAMETELAARPPVDDPVEDAFRRFAALGTGYIRFAVTEPGLFRTAFCRPDGPLPSDPDAPGGGPAAMTSRPYLLLAEVLNRLAELGRLDPVRREHAEVMAWSAVHGLAVLLLDGPLRSLPPEAVEALRERMIRFCRDGLGTPA